MSERPDEKFTTLTDHWELVAGLDDLQRGRQAQLALIALGERSIDPLARFLLGPPAPHPQPRMLAAEALGAIGGPRAVQGLITALSSADRKTLPLDLRLAEEAVHSAIARELERLDDRSAVGPLLQALRGAHLIEAGTVLARWGEARAVPPLVDCLEDPFIRDRAASALREFGHTAAIPLIASLLRRVHIAGAEARWSVERRAESARLLGEIGAARARPALRAVLRDDAFEVRIAGALALSRLEKDPSCEAMALLIEGLGCENPNLADECADALAGLGAFALPALRDALEREVTDQNQERRDILSPSPRLRAIARVLGRLGTPGVEVLLSLTRHANAPVRGAAIANLMRLDPATAQPALVAALRDPDARVRRTAHAWWKRHERPLHA